MLMNLQAVEQLSEDYCEPDATAYRSAMALLGPGLTCKLLRAQLDDSAWELTPMVPQGVCFRWVFRLAPNAGDGAALRHGMAGIT